MGTIKVLRIITRMNIGGPAIQAALLSAGLNKEKFSSLLMTGSVGKAEGDMSYLAAESGVEPFVLSSLQRELNLWKDIESFFKIYNFITRERPDIVHTHMAKAGAIGRLAAKLAGTPVIIHTYHGHIFHSYFSSARSRLFLLIEKILAAITDRIISISEKQKSEIGEYLNLNDGKFEIIPLGFDLAKFLADENKDAAHRLKEELKIPEDAIVIGTVGRLTAVKNQRMFIEAASNLKKRFQDKKIIFLIVGDGELREALITFSNSLGLYKDVIFAGWRKDMDSVYSAMDIVGLTSLNEGTPVALIEALANAKPVVATDVGGVRDVLEDGKSALVVPKGDVAAFTEAVSKLIEDKEKRDEFSRFGRNFIREKYSKDKLIKSIENLYIEELRRKGRYLA